MLLRHGLFLCQKERELMKDYAQKLYKSKAWQQTRAGYAKRVGGLCERCLAQGIYKPGEIVHHKRPITPSNIDNPSVTLAWDNLELLCRDCHAKAHGSAKRYKVDALGRISVCG